MSRPRFEQPPMPRCMWRGCTNWNMVSKDASICVHHAIIVSDELARSCHKPTWEERQTTARDRRIEEMQQDRQRQLEARQIEEQTRRFNAGLPPRADMFKQAPDSRVYYLKVGEHIKIGYTGDVAVRLSSYPPNSVVLGVELGDRGLEKQRHQQFHAYLAYGREWFLDTQEIRDHIATLPPLQDTGRRRMRRGPANQANVVKPKSWR